MMLLIEKTIPPGELEDEVPGGEYKVHSILGGGSNLLLAQHT